jgi:type IV pilus assembly protein PilX
MTSAVHCGSARGRTSRQHGMALVSSMLLLLIVTTQERIAGNVREKERALHAAESAEQYAEWWITFGNNLAAGATACGAGILDANFGEVQICSNTLAPTGGPAPNLGINVTQVPWTIAGVGGGPVGITFVPAGMAINAAGGYTNNSADYFAKPMFYIADVGVAADGQGEAYQIDAVGYGGSANAVAVVESTYEVAKGVQNLGGL